MYRATIHHCRVWILKKSRKIRTACHSLPSQCTVAASAAESHQLVAQEKSWQLPLTVQHALIWIPVYPVWVTKHVAWAKYKYGGISPTNYGHKRRNIVKVCVKYVSRPLNSCPWLKDFNQSSKGALKNTMMMEHLTLTLNEINLTSKRFSLSLHILSKKWQNVTSSVICADR